MRRRSRSEGPEGSAKSDTKTLLLHVGLPKVASTTLQLGLFDQHLEMASIHHLSKDDEKKEIAEFAGSFFRQEEGPSRGVRAAAYTRMHRLLDSHQSLVVSNEGFTTSWRRKVLAVRLFADEFLQSEKNAPILPRVLVLHRPFEEFLWSAYVQACFHQEPEAPILSYRAWAQELVQEAERRNGRLRVGDMAHAYARWFGAENVLVVELSSLAQRPVATYQTICCFAGARSDTSLFEALAGGRVHNSWQYKLRKKPELKERLENLRAEGLSDQMLARLSEIEGQQLTKLKRSGVRMV